MRPIIIGLLFLFTLHANAVDEIKIAVGPGPYTALFEDQVAELEKASSTKITFVGDVKKNGADFSFKSVHDGQADIGGAGIYYPDWEAMMKKNGLSDADIKAMTHRSIGKDEFKLVVSPGLTVDELNFDQAGKIFRGEIKNWKEVGGPDLPIKVYVYTTLVASNNFVKKHVLRTGEFTNDKQQAESAEKLFEALKANPGSIGFCSAPYLKKGGVKALKHPEIARDLAFITKGRPSEAAQRLFKALAERAKR